jgi:hypothetical protein
MNAFYHDDHDEDENYGHSYYRGRNHYAPDDEEDEDDDYLYHDSEVEDIWNDDEE